MSEPSEHGQKTADGRMLSKHLRQIGQEKTECSDLDPKTGEARMMTKAEALARIIWKLALGYEEEIRIENKKTGQIKLLKKKHAPDAKFVDIVYDRIEGKVATDKDAVTKKQPLSSKVSDQAKKRLNSMAEGSE